MALFVAMGWGSAAQTFVGQNIGAHKDERATRTGWITALYDAFTNIGLIASIFLAGEPILRIFDPAHGPLDLALSYLRVVGPSYLGLGAGVVLGNAMAGAGATRVTLGIDALVILGLQFPLCIGAVLAGVPIRGLFSCVALVNFVSAVAYAVVYARGSWKRGLARHAIAD
jgi:Na+-driven multidrug efflux pump